MRAIVLGSLIPLTARTIWRWLAAGHEIEEIWLGENGSGVWRRRDRRLGWLAPQWSVTAAARRFGIPLRTVGPLRKNPQLVRAGCRPHVDAVISSCFPYIVAPEMLAHYGERAVNLHPALLPRYRGPCPMTSIVFDEDFSASGVTLHVMGDKLDEGAIIAQRAMPWPADGWFRTWEADLAEAAGALAAEELPRFLAGQIAATPQTGPGSYLRSLPAGALQVDERIDERRARWLAGSLGRILPLTVQVEGRRIQIAGEGIERCDGGRPSAPAFARWRRVEVDVADARLSLRRWDHWHKRKERLRELAALARRRLAA